MKRRAQNDSPETPKKGKYDGSSSIVVSTGSTLLDLAITGTRSGSSFKQGGIPAGVIVEIWGPSGTGKTVMLCQIAGEIQKMGGPLMFHDPESRLNKQFALLFGVNFDGVAYSTPDTVTEVFQGIREWKPEKVDKHTPVGIFTDSLAALSTDIEMTKDEGDKMGGRRAKEFSEQLRKTARLITKKNIIMVCSNQIRQNMNAGPYSPKYTTPGGEAVGFYASIRLQCKNSQKIVEKKKVNDKEYTRVVGVETEIYVSKSSVDKPYRSASISIIFDYGIDDIRDNLQFLKKSMGWGMYKVRGEKVGKSLSHAIRTVEKNNLEQDLKEEVIEVWHEIESHFQSDRKPKMG